MKSYILDVPTGCSVITRQYNSYKPDVANYGKLISTTTEIFPMVTDAIRTQLVAGLSVKGSDRSTPHPFSFTKTYTEKPFGYRSTQWFESDGSLRSINEVIGATNEAFSYGLSAPLENAYNKALEKLYAQMRGSLDLSVAAAEIGQTLKMFKAAAKLSRYVLGFHPKHWANHWLEYQYGWRPLVNDVYDTLTEIRTVAPQLQRFKAKATERSERSGSFEPDYYFRRRKGNYKQVDSKRVLIEVLYAPPASTVSSLARYSSLNPASIVWELTPFSFVVDWMLDVGGYLRSLESSLVASAGFQSGYVTTTTFQDIHGSVTGNGRKDQGGLETGSQSFARVQKTFNRAILTAPPLPILPRFNAELGSTRLISAAALLSQFLKTDKDVPKRRKETQAAIDRQLLRFQRGPRKWNEVMAAN